MFQKLQNDIQVSRKVMRTVFNCILDNLCDTMEFIPYLWMRVFLSGMGKQNYILCKG